MAFHPYPQVIPQVFNPGGFGPPRRLTDASPCPWVDHPASGLGHATQRPVRTRFRYGSPTRVNLATHRKLAGSFFKRHAVTATAPEETTTTLPRLVGTRFQVLFHSPPGVLFTFPSRYSSAIGHQGVFRLSGWSRQIHTEFLGLRATWDPVRESHTFNLQGCYLLRRPFRMTFDYAHDFSLPDRPAERSERSHNPHHATPAGYHT